MQGETLATWFDRIAERRGDAGALSGVDGVSASWRSLRDQLARAAGAMQEWGIGRRDVVLIAMPDGPQALWAFLAVARIAIAFPVPHAEHPNTYLRLIAETGARVVLTHNRHRTALVRLAAERGLMLIVAEDDRRDLCRISVVRPRLAQARSSPVPDDFAAMTLTSGTEIRPKIIASTHTSLQTSIRHIADWMGLRSNDRALCLMPFMHLHSLVRTSLPTMFVGGEVIWAPGFDRTQVLNWIDRLRPTYITAVPSMYRLLLGEIERTGWRADNLSLRIAGIGSDKVDGDLLERLRDHLQIPVREFYGLTETCPFIAMSGADVPIEATGRINPVWEVRCVDENGDDVSMGLDGEIIVRGGIVNPIVGATAPQQDADGWFHTKDVGRLGPRGILTVSGRLGERIVRGGQKIEPEVIERVLRVHPAVGQVVAFGLPDPILNQRVAAVVVLHDPRLDESELLEFAATRLPGNHIPERIFIRDHIPTNDRGKISRTALSADFGRAADVRPVGIPPAAAETEVLRILRAALDNPDFGVEADFFDAGGGDSFAALNATIAIEAAFAISVPPAIFRRHSTARSLALFLARHRADGLRPQVVAVHTVDHRPPLFLLHAVDGQNSFAAPLVQVLKEEWPIYTFHETHVDSAALGERDFKTMARSCADTIRTVQERGPYHLVGHSWGARLAFEIARHLCVEDERVAFLGIIDDRSDLDLRNFGIARTRPVADLLRAHNHWALKANTPLPYSGPLTYFRATDHAAQLRSDPTAGWGYLCETVGTIDIPGDHHSVVEGDGLSQWGAAFLSALSHDAPLHQVADRDVEFTAARLTVLDAIDAGKRGNLSDEVSMYQCAVQRLPAQPHWVYSNLAEALFQDGRIADGTAIYRTAVALDPWPLTTFARFAPIWRRQKLKSLLQDAADRAAGVQIDHVSTALQKARVLWLAKRPSESEHAYRQGLRLDPQNLRLLLDYARFLGAHKRDGHAIRLLERAAGQQPEHSRNRRFLERARQRVESDRTLALAAGERGGAWLRRIADILGLGTRP